MTFTAKFQHDYPMVKDLLKSRPRPIENPDRYILPDLVKDCTFPAKRNNAVEKIIGPQSAAWFQDNARYEGAKLITQAGLKADALTSACYSVAPESQMRMIADYLNWLFNMDDWMDDYGVNDTEKLRDDCMAAMHDPHGYEPTKRADKMTQDYYKRFAETAGPGTQERFKRTMKDYFDAVVVQSRDRADNITPQLEEYIEVRRDTSGCYPCFQLAEYAAEFDLPQEVVDNELIKRMEQSTNDLVTWSNDIFSYDKEQIRDDTHNMIPIVMEHHNYKLQEAVDFVGAMCSQAMKNFKNDREALPKFSSPEIDLIVWKYGEGLQDWISGSLHWSFETERYFGKEGAEVKKHRTVMLSPKAIPN